MVCHCSLAGTEACNNCHSLLRNVPWVAIEYPNVYSRRTKKTTITREFDDCGQLIKEVVLEENY